MSSAESGGPAEGAAAPESGTESAPESGAESGAESSPRPGSAGGLRDRDRAVLAVERRSWPAAGVKERVIRERLGMSPTRYYQLLNVLLDDPAALAHYPVTVNRLRRIRETRRSHR